MHVSDMCNVVEYFWMQNSFLFNGSLFMDALQYILLSKYFNYKLIQKSDC